MARIRLDIRQESYERLVEIAVAERRPPDWQAEWLLMKAIDEYFLPMLRPEAPDLTQVQQEKGYRP
jgi:hypothetical protein